MYTTIENTGKHEVDPPRAYEINHTPMVGSHDGLSPQRLSRCYCCKILRCLELALIGTLAVLTTPLYSKPGMRPVLIMAELGPLEELGRACELSYISF